MMMPPVWMSMPEWQLKLMDMLTPAKTVQDDVDRLLQYNPEELHVRIQNNAVFVLKAEVMRIPPPHPERFPLSKLRKDQLDKLREIMEKQQS